MSKIREGENNPMYSKNHSPETKLKISEGKKDRPHSAETKAKMACFGSMRFPEKIISYLFDFF
jgi:hypothetical protein